MIMICPNCGAENAETSRFCTSCGTQLHAAPAESQRCKAQANPGEAPVYAPGTQPITPPAPGYGQGFSYQDASQRQSEPECTYPVSGTDEGLRLANFVLCLISCIGVAALIVPLAWLIPMTVRSWNIYKGKKPNTTAFGVCTLIFANFIGGILLLVSKKDA